MWLLICREYGPCEGICGTQLGYMLCPFQLAEFPGPQRIWPWQWQKRACPTDTGVTATLDVTRPLEMDWTIHTKTSSSGKCITGYLTSVYLQDKNVWQHKTRTNARLSSLVQLIHIKSSAWPANTPRINPWWHFHPSSNLAWYQLIQDI